MLQNFFWTWIPWIFNKTNGVFLKSRAIYKVVYNELVVKKEWIFIKKLQIPVSSEHFGNIRDDAIQWRCSLNPVRFIKPGFTENEKEKRLSYLGFTLKIQGNEIDLSDWINNVRWKGSEEPTIKEIFLLWSCESGEAYFHCLDEAEVEIVTDMGDTLRVPIGGL